MEMVQQDLPFRQSIEMTKPVPGTGFRHHRKTEVDALGSTIRMWVGGFGGTPFETCVVRAVKNRERRSECPIQEMWRRVLLEIYRQDFIIVNLKLGRRIRRSFHLRRRT